jgi:hypothetical protein
MTGVAGTGIDGYTFCFRQPGARDYFGNAS